jgi:hypothetical protein
MALDPPTDTASDPATAQARDRKNACAKSSGAPVQ